MLRTSPGASSFPTTIRALIRQHLRTRSHQWFSTTTTTTTTTTAAAATATTPLPHRVIPATIPSNHLSNTTITAHEQLLQTLKQNYKIPQSYRDFSQQRRSRQDAWGKFFHTQPISQYLQWEDRYYYYGAALLFLLIVTGCSSLLDGRVSRSTHDVTQIEKNYEFPHLSTHALSYPLFITLSTPREGFITPEDFMQAQQLILKHVVMSQQMVGLLKTNLHHVQNMRHILHTFPESNVAVYNTLHHNYDHVYTQDSPTVPGNENQLDKDLLLLQQTIDELESNSAYLYSKYLTPHITNQDDNMVQAERMKLELNLNLPPTFVKQQNNQQHPSHSSNGDNILYPELYKDIALSFGINLKPKMLLHFENNHLLVIQSILDRTWLSQQKQIFRSDFKYIISYYLSVISFNPHFVVRKQSDFFNLTSCYPPHLEVDGANRMLWLEAGTYTPLALTNRFTQYFDPTIPYFDEEDIESRMQRHQYSSNVVGKLRELYQKESSKHPSLNTTKFHNDVNLSNFYKQLDLQNIINQVLTTLEPAQSQHNQHNQQNQHTDVIQQQIGVNSLTLNNSRESPKFKFDKIYAGDTINLCHYMEDYVRLGAILDDQKVIGDVDSRRKHDQAVLDRAHILCANRAAPSHFNLLHALNIQTTDHDDHSLSVARDVHATRDVGKYVLMLEQSEVIKQALSGSHHYYLPTPSRHFIANAVRGKMFSFSQLAPTTTLQWDTLKSTTTPSSSRSYLQRTPITPLALKRTGLMSTLNPPHASFWQKLLPGFSYPDHLRVPEDASTLQQQQEQLLHRFVFAPREHIQTMALPPQNLTTHE